MVKKAANERKEFTGELLLIVDPWVDRKTFLTGKLSGMLINSGLVMTHYGQAEVTGFKDGFSTIRLFRNAVWVEVEDE